MKKGDKNGRGGHLGCPSSYNFNEYKQYQTSVKLNSQGREQTNALVERCANNLRQKSYHNFMRYMRLFFAIRNLMSTNQF